MENFPIQSGQMEFPKGLINAPGMLGFAPEKKKKDWWAVLDAFVTKPISYRPRKAIGSLEVMTFPEGKLLNSSYPNPGFSRILRDYGGHWANAEIPIIVTLIEEDPSRLKKMIRRIEEVDNVMATELILGEDYSAQLVKDLCAASLGELPSIANISGENALAIANEALNAGATAISLGPSTHSIPNKEGSLIEGKLYGPGNFPKALSISKQMAEAGIPIIGGGGVFKAHQAKAMLDAGAIGVQLDTVLWKADWDRNKWVIR